MVQKSKITNARLEKQRVQLEETVGKHLAAKALGFPGDQSYKIAAEMDARINAALWIIDDFDWICEIEAQMADYLDEKETQACAVF